MNARGHGDGVRSGTDGGRGPCAGRPGRRCRVLWRRQTAAGQGGRSRRRGRAPLAEAAVRTNFADTAKWIATLTTDATGRAEVDLDMPENLTGWKIKVWGIGQGTRVGSGEAEIVTRKDLIVRLQAPRFFVQKDEVVLSANVHNYLKTDKEVTVVLETPGDVLALVEGAEPTVKVTIPAGGEQRVDWRVKVAKEGEAVVRMKSAHGRRVRRRRGEAAELHPRHAEDGKLGWHRPTRQGERQADDQCAGRAQGRPVAARNPLFTVARDGDGRRIFTFPGHCDPTGPDQINRVCFIISGFNLFTWTINT